MYSSPIAQFVLDALLKPSDGHAIAGLRRHTLRWARSVLINLSDPLVRFKLADINLLMPISHELPFHISTFPQYLSNVGRVASYVYSKYPDLALVDIGANIGDTVAIVRQYDRIPILCIEGDLRFSELLKINITAIQDVYIEPVFIGEPNNVSAGKFRRERGTAFFVPKKEIIQPLEFVRLSKVLDSNPIFSSSKMIKIDTDGFDCAIILSELALLERMKPVIFFEYDPYYFGALGISGFDVFQKLTDIGYWFAIIYDNTGDYLLSTELSNAEILQDINTYYSGRHGARYCDICVFHREDDDLARKVRIEERIHGQKTREFGHNSLSRVLNG